MPALYPIYDCQSGEGLESFGGTFGSPRSGCLAARRCADAFGSGFSGFRMPGGALLYGGPRPQNCLQGDGSLPSVDRTLGLYRREQRIESDYRKEVTGYGDTKRDCAAAQGLSLIHI